MAAIGDYVSALSQGTDSAPIYEISFPGQVQTLTFIVALSNTPTATISPSSFTSTDQSTLESALQSGLPSGSHLKKFSESSATVF